MRNNRESMVHKLERVTLRKLKSIDLDEIFDGCSSVDMEMYKEILDLFVQGERKRVLVDKYGYIARETIKIALKYVHDWEYENGV